NFKPVAYPQNDYGKFYTGDSYLVLNTKINKRGEKTWDIHFWLGSQTSQDEAGSAAIFAVQLDDQLGGVPVQYRETQEHESQLFLSYFKNGVRYLPGGIASGFKHVDPNAFEKRLFQVKGSRNIRVKQVDPVVSAMNRGDCFILDVGRDIYIYVGAKSKRVERLKAISAANQIRDQDHAGKAKVHIIDEYSPDHDFAEFFSALGSGSASSVPDESSGGDDAQFESSQERSVALYRVSDASGSLKVDMVAQKPLQQSLLDGEDCFILDTTDSNIFVWVGKKCTNKEKQESMTKAQNFLTSKKYPAWTQVQRIVEGAEPTAFTQYFQSWRSRGELHSRLVRSPSTEKIAPFDPRLFHAEIKGRSSKFEVEEVIDFQQEDLNDDDVMLLDVGKELYIWIGNGATVREKAKASDLAKLHLQKYGREDAVVTTITQGHEPASFQSIFPTWDPDFWDALPSYDDIKAKIEEENNAL
ncbi:gelsolin, partial [Asbolus verrucosus]